MEALKACVHVKAAVALNPFESLNHVCPCAPCHVNRIWRVFLVRLFVDLAPPLRIEQGIGIVLRIMSRKKKGSCFRLGLALPVETLKKREALEGDQEASFPRNTSIPGVQVPWACGYSTKSSRCKFKSSKV